jgi:ArsR family transcriptional regulator, zinc-responsive transcriptional repressor
MDEALKLQIIFQTLGDANRLRIIRFIGDKERSVNEIVNETKLSQPLVSHHLRSLKKIDILETKRQGPFIFHKLKDKRILDVLGILLEISKTTDEEYNSEPMFFCPPWWRKNF